MCLTLFSPSHSTLFPSRDLKYPSCTDVSSSIHYFSPINPFPPQPDFTQYNMVIWDASSLLLTQCSHILHKRQHILLHQHQIYHALYLYSILVPCHPCVLMQTLVFEVCVIHTQPPFSTELHHSSHFHFILELQKHQIYWLSPYFQFIHSGLQALIIYTHFILYPQFSPCHSRNSPLFHQFFHWGHTPPPHKL